MKIGWIGTGNMGLRMAKRLVQAGNDLLVYNRTAEKARRLVEDGNEKGVTVRIAESITEVAENSDIIFTSLTGEDALRSVLLGSEGVFNIVDENSVIVEMSTISPDFAEELHTEARLNNLRYLDAPVIGSMFMVEKGLLKVITSGDIEAYSAAETLLKSIGMTVEYVGPGAEARLLKLAVNMVICSYFTLCSEVLITGEALGFSWNELMHIMMDFDAAAPMLTDKGTTLAERGWNSKTALTSIALKDLTLVLEYSKKLDCKLPMTCVVRQYDKYMNLNEKYREYSSFGTVAMIEDSCGITPETTTKIEDGALKEKLTNALIVLALGLEARMFEEALNFTNACEVDEDIAVKYISTCHGASKRIRQKAEAYLGSDPSVDDLALNMVARKELMNAQDLINKYIDEKQLMRPMLELLYEMSK